MDGLRYRHPAMGCGLASLRPEAQGCLHRLARYSVQRRARHPSEDRRRHCLYQCDRTGLGQPALGPEALPRRRAGFRTRLSALRSAAQVLGQVQWPVRQRFSNDPFLFGRRCADSRIAKTAKHWEKRGWIRPSAERRSACSANRTARRRPEPGRERSAIAEIARSRTGLRVEMVDRGAGLRSDGADSRFGLEDPRSDADDFDSGKPRAAAVCRVVWKIAKRSASHRCRSEFEFDWRFGSAQSGP